MIVVARFASQFSEYGHVSDAQLLRRSERSLRIPVFFAAGCIVIDYIANFPRADALVWFARCQKSLLSGVSYCLVLGPFL